MSHSVSQFACVQTSPSPFVARGKGTSLFRNKGNRRRLHAGKIGKIRSGESKTRGTVKIVVASPLAFWFGCSLSYRAPSRKNPGFVCSSCSVVRLITGRSPLPCEKRSAGEVGCCSSFCSSCRSASRIFHL